MSKKDEDLRRQLEDTRAELLRSEMRVEFRDLVAQSIEDLTESVSDMATEMAVLRERVTHTEKETAELRERISKQESSPLNQLSNFFLGWFQKGPS